MIPTPKTARTAAESNGRQPSQEALTLKELEAVLKERIGWVDELISPFALGQAPDDEAAPH